MYQKKILGNNCLISITSVSTSNLYFCPFNLIELNLSIIFCKVRFSEPILIKTPKTANPSCLLELIASFGSL